MKKTKLIAVVLSLCMLLALVPVAALAAEFTDADEVSNESYADAIDRWADEGVIKGNADGSFNPKGTMTRVQGFGIIANLLNLTEKADLSEYTDVPTDGWKADYLAKVVAAGIVTGYPDKTLRPEGELTREQMFVTIAKTLGIQPVETDDEAFEDIGDAAGYAAPYINALHKMGAVNGSNGKVNPLATLSREGAALLLDNLIGGYANADGETAVIAAGKITLIVADNAKVEGTANELPIVIAGQAHIVDMRGVKGAATVIVTVPGVEIRNAPVGTKVTVTEGVTGVRVNGRTVSGGQTITVEGTSGGGSTGGGTTDYSYTITYMNGDETLTTRTVSGETEVLQFTVLSDEDAGLTVDTGYEFAGWATAPTAHGLATYAVGATYDISDNLTLYAQIIQKNDYIAMAVKGTMDKINSDVIAVIDSEDDGIGTKGSSVKIDRLAYSGWTDGNGTRPQTVSGSVTASVDLANYIVQYACDVATTLLSNPEETPDKSEVEKVVRTVVDQLEDALGIEIMRSDGIKKTAEKILKAVKNKVNPAESFRNMPQNKYCIEGMTLSINGVNEAVVKVVNDQATLQLPVGKTRSEVVSNVALAVAKDLYADLKTKTTPASKLVLDATVDVTFTPAQGVGFEIITEYPVTVKLTLDAGTLGRVWYNPNAKTMNEQDGAVVVKVNANTIEATYKEQVKGVINTAIDKMKDSLKEKLGTMVTEGGALAGLTSAVGEFGVSDSTTNAESYVKGILENWLDDNLEGGLNSRLATKGATLINTEIETMVSTLSTKASEKAIKTINNKIAENPNLRIWVEGAIQHPDFVAVKEDGQASTGQIGVKELGESLKPVLGDDFTLDFSALDKLNNGLLERYIYSVIYDNLKAEYDTGTRVANRNDLTTGVNALIDAQLDDLGTEDLFETLNKVSTLKGLAGLKLKEIKTLVNDPNVKDVVSGLGLSESLKKYIDKIPTDRLGADDTVSFWIGGTEYKLSGDELGKFKTEASSSLVTALANLVTPKNGKEDRSDLKLNMFDVTDGVRVDINYNASRQFTFYLWIDGLK